MLSIIVPAYNEAHHIYHNLLRISEKVETVCGSYEIILVDDGSTDNTHDEALRAVEENSNIRPHRLEPNRGKGYAIKEGFRKSRKELVTFIDADLDIPPEQLQVLLDTFEKTKADVIIQSKRHPESIVNNFPLKRRILSRGYNQMLRILFQLPVTDTQVGIKLYRREVLEQIMPKLLVKRYAADVEQLLLAYKHGYTIAETPAHIEYKPAGDTIRAKDVFNIAWDTAAIFYRLKLKRYYDNGKRL